MKCALLGADEVVSATTRRSENAPIARRPRPGRILVVDDGDANRQLIRLVLKRAGLTITEAENGKEALDRTEHEAL